MEVHPETGAIHVGRLDGNAIAGSLSEIFRADMTMASGECRNCGLALLLADAVVELDDAGYIVICPGCSRVLFTVVRSPARTWIDLQGICGLGIPA